MPAQAGGGFRRQRRSADCGRSASGQGAQGPLVPHFGARGLLGARRMNVRRRVEGVTKGFMRGAQRALWPDTGVTVWEGLVRRDGAFWERARQGAKGGPPVLIATSTGGHPAVTPVESLLAVALTLRGADVRILLCDKVLTACLQATREELPSVSAFAKRGPRPLCASCFRSGMTSFRSLGLPILRYGELATPSELQEIETLSTTLAASSIAQYREGPLSVGEHALAGALRYFAKGTLDGEPHGEAVLRRYLAASLLSVRVAERLLETGTFEAWVFNHGIYVPQGLIGEVARSRGVRVVNWNPAYRKKCFIFSHGDTYHHTLMNEPTTEWEDLVWTQALDERLMAYLKSRWHGSQDWIWFHERPITDGDAIRRQLGIDPGKPLIGMLTNVIWDAQLHYPANAFSNMIEWALKTIDYFKDRPDLQLVIRVHPAEITGGVPSRQRMVDVVREAFPRLPQNVLVIPPDSRISTYALMSMCDSVVIYGTKTGVELTSLGTPVIVAGEAWIRNKGISRDVSSPEEYFRLLDTLPAGKRLDEAAQVRARKYAFHFFFRRMIPLASMEPRKGWPPYSVGVQHLAELMPGRDRGLDVICDGILTGSSFVFADEKINGIM